MPTFHRYLGIDYSGAETAESSLKGLRVGRAALKVPATATIEARRTDPERQPPTPAGQ